MTLNWTVDVYDVGFLLLRWGESSDKVRKGAAEEHRALEAGASFSYWPPTSWFLLVGLQDKEFPDILRRIHHCTLHILSPSTHLCPPSYSIPPFLWRICAYSQSICEYLSLGFICERKHTRLISVIATLPSPLFLGTFLLQHSSLSAIMTCICVCACIPTCVLFQLSCPSFICTYISYIYTFYI